MTANIDRILADARAEEPAATPLTPAGLASFAKSWRYGALFQNFERNSNDLRTNPKTYH